MRMDAYYYEFTPTGDRDIDRILSAVATAGKMFHHTDGWSDELSHVEVLDGIEAKSCVELIQKAATKAAQNRAEAAQALHQLETLGPEDKVIGQGFIATYCPGPLDHSERPFWFVQHNPPLHEHAGAEYFDLYFRPVIKALVSSGGAQVIKASEPQPLMQKDGAEGSREVTAE